MHMQSSSFQTLVFFVILYRSFIECDIILKEELKSPSIVWGEVLNYKCDEVTKSYELDTKTKYNVPLQDLRSMDKRPNLETDGFTWVSGRRTIEGKFWGHKNVKNEYKSDLEEDSIQLVKDLIGSKSAISFGSVYRDASSSKAKDVISVVHSDMSPEGADFFKTGFQEKLLASKDPDKVEFGKKMKKGKDVMILNVWRPLKIVQDNPLGLCKWDSLLQEDAINFDQKIKATNILNSFQAWRYREGQSWFYVSNQRPDEALVFIQHDSRAGGHGINVPHASFTLKDQVHRGRTRISFETRIIAIVDSPSDEGRISKINRKFKSLLS